MTLSQLYGELFLKHLIASHCVGNVRVEYSVLQHQVELCLRMWLSAAFEISTSNCFPTLQTCSMNLENPNVAQPCMRTPVIRLSLQDLQKVWTHTNCLSGQLSTKAPELYCLHTDVLHITSNSNKFYLYIFKIHGGITSLRLHSCDLGYLGKDSLHQSQPAASSHQQWTNDTSKKISRVLCDIPSLFKTILLYNFP